MAGEASESEAASRAPSTWSQLHLGTLGTATRQHTQSARGGAQQVDLQKKMKPFAKSLLLARLLGKAVDDAKYSEVRAAVLAADPNWARVEAAIVGRVLHARS